MQTTNAAVVFSFNSLSLHLSEFLHLYLLTLPVVSETDKFLFFSKISRHFPFLINSLLTWRTFLLPSFLPLPLTLLQHPFRDLVKIYTVFFFFFFLSDQPSFHYSQPFFFFILPRPTFFFHYEEYIYNMIRFSHHFYAYFFIRLLRSFPPLTFTSRILLHLFSPTLFDDFSSLTSFFNLLFCISIYFLIYLFI